MSRANKASILLAALSLVVMAAAGQAVAADGGPRTTTNSIGMNLTLVPAGEFMMGGEADRIDVLNQFLYCDPRWLDGEYPRHRVQITRPFYMAQCEVTLGQFLTFYHDAKYKLEMEKDGKAKLGYGPDGKSLIESRGFRPWTPGWKIEMDHPVVFVTWNDAQAFCQWLSKREGAATGCRPRPNGSMPARAAARAPFPAATIRKSSCTMAMSPTTTAN